MSFSPRARQREPAIEGDLLLCCRDCPRTTTSGVRTRGQVTLVVRHGGWMNRETWRGETIEGVFTQTPEGPGGWLYTEIGDGTELRYICPLVEHQNGGKSYPKKEIWLTFLENITRSSWVRLPGNTHARKPGYVKITLYWVIVRLKLFFRLADPQKQSINLSSNILPESEIGQQKDNHFPNYHLNFSGLLNAWHVFGSPDRKDLDSCSIWRFLWNQNGPGQPVMRQRKNMFCET